MAVTAEQSVGYLTLKLQQDRELSTDVREALLRYDPIRTSDSLIDVVSDDGIVTISGVVRSRPMKFMAERLTRRVPGVRDVRNQLVTDTDIEIAVGLELSMNPGLRQISSSIHVKSILATVYLAGDIATESIEEAEDLKARAEKLARQVPGVQQVMNGIVARERGQAVAAAAPEGAAGGSSAEAEAKLAELRERRSVWAERARAAGS